MLKVTPIAYSIHREKESPVFGTDSFHVSLDDQAGGEYLVIESVCPSEPDEGNKMSMDYEILDKIVEIAEVFKKNERDRNEKEEN